MRMVYYPQLHFVIVSARANLAHKICIVNTYFMRGKFRRIRDASMADPVRPVTLHDPTFFELIGAL